MLRRTSKYQKQHLGVTSVWSERVVRQRPRQLEPGGFGGWDTGGLGGPPQKKHHLQRNHQGRRSGDTSRVDDGYAVHGGVPPQIPRRPAQTPRQLGHGGVGGTPPKKHHLQRNHQGRRSGDTSRVDDGYAVHGGVPPRPPGGPPRPPGSWDTGGLGGHPPKKHHLQRNHQGRRSRDTSRVDDGYTVHGGTPPKKAPPATQPPGPSLSRHKSSG